jgi:uncharacterized membrane protein
MHPDPKPGEEPVRQRRIEAIDIARGLALLAMASYHFTWDLEFFGYAPPGMTGIGGWKFYARCIASSFLFLAGVSLVLAHHRGIRWPGFWKRFAMVAGAAAAISLATYLAMPSAFIFFGILHEIALASLLGLAFLRLPPLATLAVAAGVVALPQFYRAEVFDQPALWWVGLQTVKLHSNDYVPVFPWFGAVLAGIAAARLAMRYGLLDRLARLEPGAWSRPLQFIGRHSLAFYLVHQPILIGCMWLFAQIAPPAPRPPDVVVRYECEASCKQSRDEAFCARYCDCIIDELSASGDLPKVAAREESPELADRVSGFVGLCIARIEEGSMGDPAP